MRLLSDSTLLLALGVALPGVGGAQETSRPDAFLDSDGVRIRYLVRGSGSPVLLVHGFSVNLELNWLGPGILDSLASRYTVITLDLRGHGASDKPHDPAAYGTPFVEDLVRLLDHLGIQRAHIVGYSMGAVITLKLLTTYPERVASAVLGGAGWRPAEMGPPERVAGWQRQRERVARGETTIAEVLAGPDAPLLTPQMRAAFNRNDPAALAAVLQGNRGLLTITEAELRANTIPVLAVVGETDWARTDVERMTDVMANLEVAIVPGATHLTTVGHPLFLQALVRFLGSQ